MREWNLRHRPAEVVRPVPVDPTGRNGPTKGQAAGPFWRRTTPGLYVPSDVPRHPDQRIVEQAARLPAEGAVTGWAALRWHGVGYCDGVGDDGRTQLPVELVVPGAVSVRSSPAAVLYRDRLDDHERTVLRGLRVTTPARAAFDAARRAPGVRAAVVFLDLALAAGVVNQADLDRCVGTKPGWRGVRQVVEGLRLADPRCMSPAESALRLIWLLDAGLPPPRSNWPVADGHGVVIGRPDLLSTELRVVGEFDGAEHRTRARQRDDVRRDEAFRRAGLEPFRVVGADLREVRVVVERMRTAIERARSLTPDYRLRADPGPV